MRYAPTIAVGALALGLLAFVEGPFQIPTPANPIATDGMSFAHVYNLHSGRSVFTPADEVGAIVTPTPDFFGSILTTR